MADLIVYSLKTCDTCRKALAELRAAGLDPVVIDVRDNEVPREVLEGLVAALGAETLVNRRSTTWRGLDAAVQAQAMDPATTTEVLAAHPTLMKRPVIAAEQAVHVGWTPAVRKALTG